MMDQKEYCKVCANHATVICRQCSTLKRAGEDKEEKPSFFCPRDGIMCVPEVNRREMVFRLIKCLVDGQPGPIKEVLAYNGYFEERAER